MFDAIIKQANMKMNHQKVEMARKANNLLKLSDRPRRFVMIAFDQNK